MRRSRLLSVCPAICAGLLAVTAASGAFAEDSSEKVETDGSTQITPAGPDDTKPAANSLTTVPIDNLGSETTGMGPNGRLVRELMAARPNEDLIICVAGCFSGRDRVVYAQPMERRAPALKQSQTDSITPSPGTSKALNGSSDGSGGTN